jgi:hypothetical protein
MRRRDLIVIAFVLAAATLAAQPLDRLTGRVLTIGGAPIRDADVHVEAIFGFAGGDFLGQRTFSTVPAPRASGRCSLQVGHLGLRRLGPASCRMSSRCRSTWLCPPAPA